MRLPLHRSHKSAASVTDAGDIAFPPPASSPEEHEHAHEHSHGGEGHLHGAHAHGDVDAPSHSHPEGGRPSLSGAQAYAQKEAAHGHGHHHGGLGDEPLRVALISSAVLGLAAVIELAAGLFSGSSAVVSDSFHNLADVSTTVALGGAFVLSRRGPTKRFPYGYHRVEDLAGLLVLVLILASAGLAGLDSISHLFHPVALTDPLVPLVAALVGVLANELVGQYKLRAAERAHSTSLAADGRHSLLDAAVSVGAAVGVIGSWLGFHLLDPLAGLALTVLILYVAWQTGGQVMGRLLDQSDSEMEELVTELAADQHGMVALTRIRTRWLGRQLHAELTIEVDANVTVEQGHAVAESLRQTLLHEIPPLVEVLIHVDPAGVVSAHKDLHGGETYPGSATAVAPPG